MPTVAILGPFKLLIYFNDHGRPHVHVISTDAAAVVEIRTRKVIHNDGIWGRDLRLILRFIADREVELMEAWQDAKK